MGGNSLANAAGGLGESEAAAGFSFAEVKAAKALSKSAFALA
jgi:hypothetical protein